MAWRTVFGVAAVSVLVAGCLAGPRRENAALRMRSPGGPPPRLLIYATPDRDYPSTGGDILKGASPGEQAAERAAASATPAVKP